MGAADRFAAAQRQLDAIETEQQDRRALRSRQIDAAKAQAQQNFARQGATMQKFVERLQEMGERKRKAGGWETSSGMTDRPVHFSFGGEDAGEANGATRSEQAPPQHQPVRQNSLSGAALFADNTTQTAPAQPPPVLPREPESSEQPAAPVKPPARPARRRPVQDDLDEDDYTNHSWMR